MVNCSPLTKKRVLCKLLRLHLGHVTLLKVEFQPPRSSPQSDVGRREAFMLGSASNF